MTRLSAAFSKPHPALVAFITAGDGDTASNLDALVAGGADVIELGMPFTDPMADGPVIQEANIRSLNAGTTTADIFTIANAFRKRHPDTPLVLMGYANPMTIRGGEWFASECNKAGVDGVICVDIPPEEDPELGPALRNAGIDLIRLATPTTDAARLPTVLDGASGFLYYVSVAGIDLIRLATPTTDGARLPTVLDGASGFLYYVSVAGITGLQVAAQTSIDEAVARLKAHTDLPVAVGFGVRTPEQAAKIARVADGVVVGSAIVELVAQHGTSAAGPVRDYVASLKQAIVTART